MLRASDGHAKNFSIFLRPGGAYDLTHLYDVLSAYLVSGTGANQLSPFKVKWLWQCVHSSHKTTPSITRRPRVIMNALHGVLKSDDRDQLDLMAKLVEQTSTVIDHVIVILPQESIEDLEDIILNRLANETD